MDRGKDPWKEGYLPCEGSCFLALAPAGTNEREKDEPFTFRPRVRNNCRLNDLPVLDVVHSSYLVRGENPADFM